MEQTGSWAGNPSTAPVQSAVAASLASESGVIIPVQTPLVFFQVSMADLCLVPQVANAER